MDQSVTFKDTPIPTWEAVSTLLSSKGYAVQMRMIDGQLAFPDEQPTDDWKELRVGTPQGMITIRREPQRLVFVTWGNADVEMQKAWNALTWAFAEVGNGVIETGHEGLSAAQFRGQVALPESLRS
jgi:hypothetical protein